MSGLRRFVLRLVNAIHPGRAESDLARQVRSHLTLLEDEFRRRGMCEEEASLAAKRAFGGVEQTKEAHRDARSFVWLDDGRRDVQYALRALRRSPGFSAVVILTLALGVGMNTAVFSAVNAVLLRPLSYPQSQRLVWLATTDPIFKEEIVPRYDFRSWREQGKSFDRMVAYTTEDNAIGVAHTAIRERVAHVSDDFWEMARPPLAFGRLPAPGERNVLLLSHAIFEQYFKSDPASVGLPGTLDGLPVTIVGVLEKDFRFDLVPPPRRDTAAEEVEAYVPLEAAPQDAARSRGRTVSVVARLGPDVTIDRAREELEVIRARVARDSPNAYLDEMPLSVVPLRERLVADVRLALWVLLGAVTCVLLIACATVANLLLARASARRKEIAIRVSLGAGRARVLRQFLTESMVLACIGGATGLIAARWSLSLVVQMAPHAAPRLGEASVDARVVGFAILTSIVSVLVFGLVPALSIWKTDLHDAMRDGTRAISGTAASVRLRRLLVAAELAIAVVLLIGGGLMMKSLWRMNERPPGFHPESILIMKVRLAGAHYQEAQARHAYTGELIRRVGALSGVEAVGVTPQYPIRTGLGVKGRRWSPQAGIPIPTALNATSAGYAKTMGLQVLRGRWINETEATPAVVINERLARREFGEEDPIGASLSVQAIAPNPTVPFYVPIVGVVSDVKHSKLDRPAEPEVYVPYTHVPIGSGVALVVRVAGNPVAFAPTIRKVMIDLDPTQPVSDVETLEAALTNSVAPQRFIAFMLNAFALTALVLAVVGIYGVIAYSVAQRTREIGLRMAVGATRRDVVAMMVRQGMGLALIGIAIGLVAAAGLTRLLTSLLYDLAPVDPPTFTAVAALLGVSAFVASWLPALSASFIDPNIALRSE